jgi:hypothetical protein
MIQELSENHSDESEKSMSDAEDDQCYSSESSETAAKHRVHHPTTSARKLVRYAKLSTHQASKVCSLFKNDNYEVATPSQSGIHKAVFREARKLKEEYVRNLKSEDWSLHFDGKSLKNLEHQVVVLKNEEKEIRLAALVLPDGKAQTIANGIQSILTEYNLWPAIKMIVSDTTAVNTGKKGGVIVKLQCLFEKRGLLKPTYIGCQHHILDRVLRHVFDSTVGKPQHHLI